MLLRFVLLVALTGCADLGRYTWADDLPAAPRGEAYLIAPGDVLSIKVFNHEDMSAHGKVRSDGKLSVPFLSEVICAGYTPQRLAGQIQERLKDYVKQPLVTVYVEEVQPHVVSVLGEVTHPGLFPLAPTAGVLHALSAAGGLTDFAHRDRIFVLRRGDAAVQRIRFSYRALSQASGMSAQFRLQDGDSVVVE